MAAYDMRIRMAAAAGDPAPLPLAIQLKQLDAASAPHPPLLPG